MDVKGLGPLSIAGQGVLSLALCFVLLCFDLFADHSTRKSTRTRAGAALTEQIVVQVVPAPSRVVSAPGALWGKGNKI